MSLALKTILPAAVLGLRGVRAQATIDFYSKPGCELDFTDPESMVSSIQVYGEDKSDDDLECFQTWWSNDDWPTDDDGNSVIWVDQSGIEDGCKLMLYEMTPPGNQKERSCVSTYVTFSDMGKCSPVALPATYGYSYCCGDSCGNNEVQDLFSDNNEKKRRDVVSPPPVSDLFDKNGSKDRKPRDVVSIKKRAPLDRLERRDECKWENHPDNDPKKPYLVYEKQYRVGPISKCNLKDGCEGSIDISYSETISQSFSEEAGIGATLFEAIGLSMSFSYSEEEAKENGYTYSHKYSVPNGASGYVAWEPIAECAYGKFEGDCEEWESNKKGEACFLKMVNGIPDGTFTNVLEY